MRIHFDNTSLSYGTGPNSFARRLAITLYEMGHQLTDSGPQADVSLVFIEPSGNKLAPKVVQRLDGIWFKPDEFKAKNVGIKELYDCRADAVVWQSQFDCNMSLFHWGTPGQHHRDNISQPFRQDCVIGNGTFIDPVKEVTIPALSDLRAQYELVYVCSSNWHPQKRLKASVQLFEHLRKKHQQNSCLIILGNNPDHRATGPHVFYAGSVGPDVYDQVYSVADWMLHLAWADHCPNVVVEALAQGTPVVCSEVGGTKELVGGYGIILKESQPYNFELYDYDNPPDIDVAQVEALPTRHQLDYGTKADIDIKNVAQRYVRLFESVITG